MMETFSKYLIYFILGGLIVTLATYFGSEKRGLVAAFFAMFPVVTAFTLFTIYSASGSDAVTSYVKGLLLLTPIWIIYLLIVLYLLPKYNFWIALATGIIVYMLIASILVFRY
ncbi:MAG: DUF3147 domain-containing protein [Methanobacterium sp.]|mgnify:FL=1|nr:DUF3147 domain-containing protein [Methanobacterium sp.]